MRKQKIKDYFKIFLFVLLIISFSVLFLKKIDLATVDLGRHLRNGQDFFEGNFKFLHSNFYSYSYPDFPFVNHHWAAGVIFFSIFKIGGFSGLHLFFLLLGLSAFFIAFRIAEKELGFGAAFVLSLIFIPIFAYRKEIRAEIFSCLFAMTFFWTLWKNRDKNFSLRSLLILPILQIIWVNTHIYFFLGPLIIGAFLLERIIFFLQSKFKKIVYDIRKLKIIFFIFALCVFASLCNPSGLKGLLHPFSIYKNYGYRVLEEQSAWFLEKINIYHSVFPLFKTTLSILILSFAALLIKNRRKFSPFAFLLAFGFSAMACISIRNIAIFGFFAMPILAINIKEILPPKQERANFFSPAKILNFNFSKTICAISALLVLVVVIAAYNQELFFRKKNAGIGLSPKNEQSAEFFKKEAIKGPIFNNYDIGSYLIYYLYPEERVFVDNRPEVYPASFFNETYIPMQEVGAIWKEKSAEYNFNVIFFSHQDYTPWGQNFLIARVNDPQWAPVFADSYAIIFLKRNEANKNIIAKYEIPKNNFSAQNLRY